MRYWNMVLAGLVVVVCSVAMAAAEQSDVESAMAKAPAPLKFEGIKAEEFLTSDGRIDLDKLRRSGYEGSLDLEGLEVRIDPVTGEPVARPVGDASPKDHPDDIYWDTSIPGMNGDVRALTVYDGRLIAGGHFWIAGGTSANYIASWDGSSWSPLGSGMSDGVSALTVYDGQLIAGGWFTTAGETSANYIASWDGSSWSPLGSGMGGDYTYVSALTVYDGRLIAVGYFTTAGETSANYIASWDGSFWSPLGSGMNSSVFALTVYNNQLIAGGLFTIAGSTSANYIASWDGSSWSPLGSGIGGGAVALTVYDGQLIAGGFFTTAGETSANRIASWDGSSWSPLGSGMNSSVSALTVYDGRLIAGGYFTTAGDTSANYIASWDGSSWSPLGSGMNSSVSALTVYDGQLIAGGYFTTAGGKACAYLASWTKGVASPNIVVSDSTLAFTAIAGDANPPSQELVVSSDGDSLEILIDGTGTWLDVSPDSAWTNATITVSVDITGLTAGEYVDSVVIVSSEAVNSPVYVPVTLSVTSGQNYALSFDCSDDWAEVPDDPSLELTSDFTMEGWVYIESEITERRWLMSKHKTSVNDVGDWTLSVHPPGQLGLQVMVNNMYTDFFSEDTLEPQSWHHFAIVYDDATGECLCYVNGSLTNVDTVSFMINDSPEPLRFGREGASTSHMFCGMFDEPRLWNVKRTQQEINEAMFDALDGTEPGLVGCWTFNEGSGQTIADISQYQNDGWLGSNASQADDNDPQWVVHEYQYPPPILTLSFATFFEDTATFYPPVGDSLTQFEFRINYYDSLGLAPAIGYPQLWLDWDGNGIIDHANDGTWQMSPSSAGQLDSSDYSVSLSLPAGGNPQIRFTATNSQGGAAEYPADGGWLPGPQVITTGDVDLYVYSSDISYSIEPPDYPEIGEPITISGRIHNNSNIPQDSVRVELWLEDYDNELIDSFYVDIPPRSGDTPGYVDVSHIDTLHHVGFYEVRLVVDPQDSVDEWNEYNNTTMRSLKTVDFVLPGYMVLAPNLLGNYYPLTQVTAGGSAWYEENGNFVSVAAGAPVWGTIVETGQQIDTAWINDNGQFWYQFTSPIDIGTYHIQLVTTDYSLSADTTIEFQVVSPPVPPEQPKYPNLVVDYNLTGLPMNACPDSTLRIGNATVYNIGDSASGPCKARLQVLLPTGETTLADIDVPALEPGHSHPLATTQQLSSEYQDEPGNYWISAEVDYEDAVTERFENDNSKSSSFKVWCCGPDLQPMDLYLPPEVCQDSTFSISAKVRNRGGRPAESFSLTLTEGSTTVCEVAGLELPAFGVEGYYSLCSYSLATTGQHIFTIIADSANSLNECDDTNNSYQEATNCVECTIPPKYPDLTTSYDSVYIDNPTALEGDQIQLQAAVTNRGDSIAYNFPVWFGLGGAGYTASPYVMVDSLEAGQSLIVEHPDLWTCDFDVCPVTVHVDSGNLVYEKSEYNNRGEVSFPYDFYPAYGHRCPQYQQPAPYMFDECSADTGSAVQIALVAANSGLLTRADSVLFFVEDRLEGESVASRICSTWVAGPFPHHAQDTISAGYSHTFSSYGRHHITVTVNPSAYYAECDHLNNSATRYIDIVEPGSPLPDLELQGRRISLSSYNPAVGESLLVYNVDVYNEGDGYAYDVDVTALLTSSPDSAVWDTVVMGQAVIDSIAPNSYFYSGPLGGVQVDSCEPAFHVVTVCADLDSSTAETNESNNNGTIGVHFCEPVNFLISNLDLNYECLCQGCEVEALATVVNNSQDAGIAEVDFYYAMDPEDAAADMQYICTQATPEIAAGDSAIIQTFWDLPEDEGYLMAWIGYTYPWDGIKLDDTANSSIPQCGNIDGSGSTPDIADLVCMVEYMFGGGCESLILAASDVDCTGGLDIADLVYMVTYMFQGGPAPCSGASPGLAKTGIRSAHSSCKLTPMQIDGGSLALAVEADLSTPVAGWQQRFHYDPVRTSIDSVTLQGDYPGIEIYWRAVEGVLDIGVLDMEGAAVLPAGDMRILSIHYRSGPSSITPQPPRHVFTLAVDRNAQRVPIDVKTERLAPVMPNAYALSQNYPNPFNPSTVINYSLPAPSEVNLSIYNILGQKVVTLIDSHQPAGYHSISWNGRNESSKPVSSGVYFYRVEAGNFTQSKKMILLK